MFDITTERNGRDVGIPTQFLDVDAAAQAASTAAVEPAVLAAAKIGEAALRAEVAKLGTVTGNLSRSIGIRTGSSKPGRSYALVGFFEHRMPHAHLVERGTEARWRNRAGVFSSWNSTGQWVGLGTYPDNFVSRSRYAGIMPAFRPLENAIKASQVPMESAVEQGLSEVGQAVIEAALG